MKAKKSCFRYFCLKFCILLLAGCNGKLVSEQPKNITQRVEKIKDSLLRQTSDSRKRSSIQFIFTHIWDRKSYLPSIDSFRPDTEAPQLSLIASNINEAYNDCNSLLNAGLAFPVFQEYVLPYKIFNERMENWRLCVKSRYKLPAPRDTGDYITIIDSVNRDLCRWFKHSSATSPGLVMTYSDLMASGGGDCVIQATLGALTLRALGVPVAIDFTCSFGNIDGAMHMWNAAIYTEDKFMPFMPAETNITHYNPFVLIEDTSDPSLTTYKRCAKVFRRTFECIKTSVLPAEFKESAPFVLADGKYVDVTHKYLRTTSVKFNRSPLSKVGSKGFIFVFNKGNWHPAYWSKLNEKHQLMFKNMALDMLYIIGRLRNGKMIPFTFPFTLDKNGNVYILNGGGARCRTMKVTTVRSIIDQQLDTMPLIKKTTRFNSIMHAITTGEIASRPVCGTHYVLYYWDRNKWRFIDKKIATPDLVFPCVPVKGLYQITSNDQFRRYNRVFSYDFDKQQQVWW